MLNILVLLMTMSISLRLKEQHLKEIHGDNLIHQYPNQNNNMAVAASGKSEPPKYHIVFTTDCKDPMQDWQSYVFFHSVFKSKQQGEVTRIVTDCGDQRAKRLKSAHQEQIEPMAPGRFHLHFGPAHPKQAEVGGLRKHMKYFNMPFGVQHWMEVVLGYSPTDSSSENIHDSTIIMLLDHDQAILRPLVHDFAGQREIWKQNKAKPNTHPLFKVVPGNIIAQHSDFPSEWWNLLEMPEHPLAAKGIAQMKALGRDVVESHYAAGLPIISTARDFYTLVQHWNEFTYPMYQKLEEKILKEPQGPYALAAAALHRPHLLAETLSVNDYRAPGLELLAQLKDYMLFPSAEEYCRKMPPSLKPHVLQYNKRYALADQFVIGKLYVPSDFVGSSPASCETPLLVEPPDDAADRYHFYMDPELGKPIPFREEAHNRQMTFMLCETIQLLNQAAIHFKEHYCIMSQNVNMQKTLTF